ncbi:transposase [Methylobacterium mesophilicum]
MPTLISLSDSKIGGAIAPRANNIVYDRLQDLTAVGIWDEVMFQQALLSEANRLANGSEAIPVADEAELPTKSNRSIGVAPQYPTMLGKTANRQTPVALTLARGKVPVAVGLALFPPETWTADSGRMATPRIPEDQRATRFKLEIAVAKIGQVPKRGVRFGCVLAGADYGSAPFRQALRASNRTVCIG